MSAFARFYQQIAVSPLAGWLEHLPALLTRWQQDSHSSQFSQWQRAIGHLPNLTPDTLDLQHQVFAACHTPLDNGQQACLTQLLRQLMPWRKGPYHLYGVHIDSEWRSDMKWQRLLAHIQPLDARAVLDVGCGNGYHLWRMYGAGARLAIGIDPTALFFCQFTAIHKLLGAPDALHFLPLGIEQLPPSHAFDTVFSMGVLYHRRSPLDHLLQLKQQLQENGELILETLVIAGGENDVLLPAGRYARMRNVYFIPSARALKSWLEKCGFVDVRIVNECPTRADEQRRTSWLRSESLSDCLDPHQPDKTIEGHPAPRRALLIARNP